MGELKTANAGSNAKDIQDAVDAVNRIWSELATKMYADAKDTPTPEGQDHSSAEGQSAEDSEIEDADFEVVDEKK